MSDPLTARLYTYLPHLATLLLTGVKLLPKYRVVWCWCMPDRIWADFSQEIIALPAISLVTALTVWIPLATHSPACPRPARHTLHCNKGSCYNSDRHQGVCIKCSNMLCLLYKFLALNWHHVKTVLRMFLQAIVIG